MSARNSHLQDKFKSPHWPGMAWIERHYAEKIQGQPAQHLVIGLYLLVKCFTDRLIEKFHVCDQSQIGRDLQAPDNCCCTTRWIWILIF